MTLLDRLPQIYPTAKRTTLRRMVEHGRVSINGRLAHNVKQPVQTDDHVLVKDQPTSLQAPHPKLPFPIVYEDSDILVIDKPAGLLTSTGPREKRPTALAMVRHYAKATSPDCQIGLIHRLDRDASGLLIFSKNHHAYLSLKRQFFEHSVERIYLAIVRGVIAPRSGTIDSRLVERADGSVHSSDQPGKGERAITYYETIGQQRHQSVLRVRLQTGKKHQIRVHLAERGTPILHDPLYSNSKPNGRLMLAAVALSIVHPRTCKTMSFLIDPPPQMEIPR
jgi:23S rRNA pseudouridine1911/1915/1917 synthase